ncbi:MAG: methyltransferase domain-containing protein [Candidatus Eisenbacteria bacterium]|nr:methyltransferase domain-containing protein [Candidatus Eisenbacteria bacterium]
MTYDIVNRATYESPKIVSLYLGGPIQCAELRILVAHRDAYWGKRVLDIGCGAGRTTEFMRTLDVTYVGVDYSERMVRECAARFPDAECTQCDARDMSCFGDESFDFVLFSNNGYDCLDHNDRLSALREINRVLKPGGLFVFSSHNKDYEHARSHPRLELSWDPFRQARMIYNFFRRWNNHRKNRKYERFEDGYWILNDSSHLYSLLTHYISVPGEVRELREHGFEALEAYGRDGMMIPLDTGDRRSSWVYYVARKTGPASGGDAEG